MLAYCVK
jgi:pectinesterase